MKEVLVCTFNLKTPECVLKVIDTVKPKKIVCILFSFLSFRHWLVLNGLCLGAKQVFRYSDPVKFEGLLLSLLMSC